MKRVVHGEPLIGERYNAPHWFTVNAERESSRRLSVSPTTSRLSAFPSAAVLFATTFWRFLREFSTEC